MQNQASLQETKQHGAVRFPFNLYPCTIPGDFPQVALHWQESMELVFVKRGAGLVQVGAVSYLARMGDIFVFTPGTLHALRQAEGQSMEYENLIFELELLGGAEDLCAEKYLLPLQSGRLSLPVRLTPNDLCYLQAAACLREVEEASRSKLPGYELLVKGALLRFLAPEFEFYRNVFYEELSTFMDAFIQAQKIFPEDAPVGDYDEFNERDMKIAFMATGIERRSRAAMIEESEAGNEKTKTTGS